MRFAVQLCCFPLLALPALAQANQNPLVDVEILQARKIQVVGRVGTYPTGTNAISFESTVCNVGQVPIPWMGPMDEDHPKFAFVVTRLLNGRMEQVSDRSFVKHGVAAGNSSNCGRCNLPPGPIGSALGVGCGDVYDVGINSFQLVLSPPDEIDPWLGTWQNACSYFDRGDPAVAPPLDCDSQRSLTQAQVALFGPVKNRLQVDDAELDVPGAFFYLGCQFVTEGEPEAARWDSLGARQFTAAFDGTTWQLTESGAFQFGSVLEQWPGASVTSATNGGDDGRVYVALAVTGPTQGFYHYEIALHDRDSARGVRAFHLPLCPGARVRGFGFHDVDDDPTNDWTATVGSGEIVFATSANPLRWNSIYNLWFDSDAAPLDASATLVANDAGTGAPSFLVTTSAPLGLYDVYLGAGCAPGQPPSLFAEGTPPRASLGNASFALVSAGNAAGLENLLYYGTSHVPAALGRCTLWTGGGPRVASTTRADASGIARHALPIPGDPELEGLEVDFQCVSLRPGPGAPRERLVLSDGLRVRVGDAIPSCP